MQAMQAIQPLPLIRETRLTLKPKPPVLKTKPLVITWEKLPPDFKLPDDPVDNINQPLLAEALRNALEQANLTSNNQLYATNFGICVTVGGRMEIKAPDWVYVPSVLPLPKGKTRTSYTPYLEGDLPAVVMEFLSETDGGEYDAQPNHPFGKWFFYEKLLKVPLYVIFDPSTGALEVYQLKAGSYQLRYPNDQERYWIAPLSLFLGAWHGTKSNVTSYWLRWWDKSGQLLPWSLDSSRQERQEKEQAQREKEQAQREKEQAQRKQEQAQQEKEQAQQEKELALQEIARLMARLQKFGIEPDNENGVKKQ